MTISSAPLFRGLRRLWKTQYSFWRAADKVVNDLDNEKVVELLIDIQSRLGRIEERVSRQEGVEAKADEALASAKLNEEKYSEVESRVTKLEQSRDWTNRTAIGAIISAAVAILSIVFPHIGG